ncbi:MAG: arsenosugar biosynthesis radical SAM protein ArsS [Planctomycetaceae bacterium]|nr:arsenosugar biosynthesis radical SAM protein ArsS [Planctomycetaceae bacterium]
MELTLLRQGSELASAARQVEILESELPVPHFEEVLSSQGVQGLHAAGLEVLQVNLGKLCNQTCRHCHVDAGPDRRESMSAEVAQACLRTLAAGPFTTLDITGGAPEMNPQFRGLVEQASHLQKRIIDRCNLTILVANGYEDLPEFLAEHQVEIVASLPCYLEENVNRQRGDRVFERSLAALRRLNEMGYGKPGGHLKLTLVYNPLGPSLPPDEVKLEQDYREQLRSRYGIEFTQLFTITNLPISRFLQDLLQQQRFEEYLQKLVSAFNPATLEGLMCRSMLSVDWQGNLYDCDFNQMLELGLTLPQARNVLELTVADLPLLAKRSIATGRHCFGCTAGAGSSCSGAIQNSATEKSE